MVISFPPPPQPPARRGSSSALTLCLVLGLLGCSPMSQSQIPVAPARATLAFCDSAAANCTSQDTFALQFVRDLNVMVNWENLPAGTHAQKISFILPEGELYQAFEKSFDVADGSTGAVTTIQALPVAGTWITQRSLTGTWSVSLELDGQAMGTSSLQFTP